MLYFFILAAWCFAVLLMAGATVATRVVEGLRPVYPIAWRVLLWSSAGFVAGNALVFGTYFAIARIAALFPQQEPQPPNVVLAAVLLAAPVVGSFAGFCAGVVLGAWLGLRRVKLGPWPKR